MANPRCLRVVFIAAAAALLGTGCGRAPASEGDGLTMEFVRIPAGSFQMGSPDSEKDRDDNEGPVHEVQITKPFYMGKYEVTQAQWRAVMGTTVNQQRQKANSPWSLKGNDPNCPIYIVSWEEAMEFCKRLGRNFRLPTEAEWEYACRAGSQTRFCYGDDPNYAELDQCAWYYGKSDNKTHSVGQKKPNTWGLYDMYGNVAEWCSDRYAFLSNYENAASIDPAGPASAIGQFRAYRGGSWLEKPERCRSANREGIMQNAGYDCIGFRVVYTGRVEGDKEVLEITVPEKAAAVSDNQPETKNRVIDGIVRDEAGLPIDDVDMMIFPTGYLWLRRYAGGRFEVCRRQLDPNSALQEYHFIAEHKQRNLALGMEIREDVNSIDVRLKPGVIVTGKVVDSEAMEVEGATVVITNLRTSDWSTKYLKLVKTDAAGSFEFRALPLGYEFDLSARKMHYLIGRTTVHSEEVRNNHVDGVTIVLPRGQFSVSGIVVGPDGKPVPDVWIYCTGKGQAGINSHTDANGRFKADGIFEGQVNISASVRGSDGGWLGGSASVNAGATDVRIVLGGNAMPPPKGRACFPAETGVWADGVLVQISEVAPCQTVGKPGLPRETVPFGRVKRTEEHVGAFECIDILLESGNRISVVDSHCFMLESGRWVAAQDLRDGFKLKTLNGAITIKTVTVRPTPFVGKVYNLKIRDSDRYAAGEDGVIVRDY